MALERRGIEVHAFATTDASATLSDGVDEHASALRTLVDVTLSADTEPRFGLPGGQLVVDLQLQRGEDGSREVGDVQAFSNIDAPDFERVAEIWLQQELWSSALSLQAGRIDANGGFAWVEHGVRFLNSSMGFSPTIVGLPTFPEATLGATGRARLLEDLSLNVGYFDSEVAGSFLIANSDATWSGGRLGLGAWRQNGNLARFDGGLEDGTSGEYLTLDQSILSDSVSGENRLGGFLQLGAADADVSPFSAHLGFGLVWEGLGVEGSSALGLGLSRVRLSDEPGANFSTQHETAWELFYSFAATDWLRIKPDLQYIQGPAGDATLDNAWVFTLRSTFRF